MDFFNKLSNTQIIIGSVIFVVIFMLSYTFFNKDNEEMEINYTYGGYSFLIAGGLTALSAFLYIKYKTENPELMKSDFYAD